MREVLGTVAIVGASTAGLALARGLAQGGNASLTVYEAMPKLATRRAEWLHPQEMAAILHYDAALESYGQMVREPSLNSCGSITEDSIRRRKLFAGGAVMDRTLVDVWLHGDACRRGVAIEHAMRLVCVEHHTRGWKLGLLDERGNLHERRADWLIDASGHRMSVATRLGFHGQPEDRLVAFACEYELPDSVDLLDTPIFEAVEEGWWLRLPLPGRRMQVVFFTDSDLVQLRSHAAFSARAEATRGIGTSLVLCRQMTGVMRTDARTQVGMRVGGERWLCLGNAACAPDLRRSSGLANELMQAQLAVERFNEASTQHRHPHESWRDRLNSELSKLIRSPGSHFVDHDYRHAAFWRRRSGRTMGDTSNRSGKKALATDIDNVG